MKQNKKNSALLKQALDASYQAEAEKLRRLQAQRAALDAELKDVKLQQLTRPTTELASDYNWRQWLQQRQAKIETDLSNSDEDIARQRGVTAKWFAKIKGHGKLEQKMRLQTRQTTTRRELNGQ